MNSFFDSSDPLGILKLLLGHTLLELKDPSLGLLLYILLTLISSLEFVDCKSHLLFGSMFFLLGYLELLLLLNISDLLHDRLLILEVLRGDAIRLRLGGEALLDLVPLILIHVSVGSMVESLRFPVIFMLNTNKIIIVLVLVEGSGRIEEVSCEVIVAT